MKGFVKGSKRPGAVIAAAAAVVLASSAVHAATRYWDLNGSVAGTGSATPDGTWSTSAANWNNPANNAGAQAQAAAGTLSTSAWPGLTTENAVFSAGSDATGAFDVTVSGAITAASVRVQEGAVTFLGTASPSLTFGTNGFTLESGVSGVTTFDSSLGTVVLAGSQTWTNDSAHALVIDANINTSSSSSGRTFTIAGTGSGDVTINGVIASTGSGALGLTVNTSAGTTKLTAANTYVGTTSLTRGLVELDFSAAAAPLADIVSFDSALVMVDSTLTIRGKSGAANAQAFDGTSFGTSTTNYTPAGASIVVVQNGATSVDLTLGGLTRNAQSTLNFVLPATGAVTTTTTSNNDGILSNSNGVVYASVNGTTWATNTAGTIGALATYAVDDFSATTNNVDVTVDSGTELPAFNVNSLRFNVAGTTLTLGTGTNSVSSGGILVTAATLGEGNGVTIDGAVDATLRGASGSTREMVILNYGQLAIDVPIIDAGGSTSLTFGGTGTTTLNGANTFTGNVAITKGTVKTGVSTDQGTSGALGTGLNNLIIMGGGTLDLAGANVGVGGVWGTGAITNTGAAATLTVGNNVSAAITFDGVLSGANLNVTKTGSGTWSLAGQANTFNNLTVNGGIVSAVTTIPGAGTSYASPVSLDGVLGVGTITLTDDGAIRVGTNSGGPSGADYNFGALSNDIVMAGNGAILHTGTNRAVNIFTGQISGAGKLTFTNSLSGGDPNALVLQNTNTYTGGTEINNTGSNFARTLVLADAVNALGGGVSGTGGVVSFVATNPSALVSTVPYLTLKANQSIAGLSSERSRAVVTGYDTTNTVTVTVRSTAGGAGDGAVFRGVLGGLGGTNIVGMGVTPGVGGTNLQLVKDGTGTQTLAGLNPYTGGTVINGGTLIVNGGYTEAAVKTATGTAGSPVITGIDTTGLVAGQFVFGAGNTVAPQIISVNPGNNSILLSANVVTAGALNLSISSLGSAVAQDFSPSATVAANTSTMTLAGDISGLRVGQYVVHGNITSGTQITSIDTGTNTVTLSANISSNSISASQTINFLATSGAGSGAVTVNDGGRLGGAGAIIGNVLVDDGGAVAPGEAADGSVGTLRVGNLTLAAGATYQAELDFAGETTTGVSDQLAVTGAVTIGGSTLSLSLLNTDGLQTKTFVLLVNDGDDAIDGTFTVLPAVTSEIDYTIAYDHNADGGSVGNDVAITFTSVPEPGSVSLAGLVAAGGLLKRRRHRRVAH